MSEHTYKKSKHSYDKEFNNQAEYMREFEIAEKPTTWGRLVSWLNTPLSLTRSKLIFIGTVILYFATPEFVKVIIAAQLPAFFNFYGAAILASAAIFVLTWSSRR